MTQYNWFRHITTVVKSSPANRYIYLTIFIILYFGFRDYKQNEKFEQVIKMYIVFADKANARAEKSDIRYESLLDKTIFKSERDNNLKDTINNYLKRLEEKIPRK